MARKPVRLQFTEDELADKKVAKAAGKAGKAADKAEKANGKLPVKHKLRRESSASANAKKKLRFGKLEIETVEAPKPVRSRRAATQARFRRYPALPIRRSAVMRMTIPACRPRTRQKRLPGALSMQRRKRCIPTS